MRLAMPFISWRSQLISCRAFRPIEINMLEVLGEQAPQNFCILISAWQNFVQKLQEIARNVLQHRINFSKLNYILD